VVVRGRIAGATPACEALRRFEALEEIARALDDASSTMPEIAWADLRIETRPPVDLDGLVDRGDLLGQLAREAAALLPDEVAALLATEEGLRGITALDPAALTAAARRAAELAVVLLGDEA
jgi:hypothetical protein